MTTPLFAPAYIRKPDGTIYRIGGGGMSQSTADARYLLKDGGTATGALTVTGSLVVKPADAYSAMAWWKGSTTQYMRWNTFTAVPSLDIGNGGKMFGYAGNFVNPASFSLDTATGNVTVGGTLSVGTLATSFPVARKFAAAIAGTATSEVITHNLATRDVQVQVVRNVSPWDGVLCDWEATSTNTVTLRFAAAPGAGQFRVVIVG